MEGKGIVGSFLGGEVLLLRAEPALTLGIGDLDPCRESPAGLAECTPDDSR